MKKQDLIQLKNTLSSLPINTKQDLISWLDDNLQMDITSVIDTSQPELCCPHCHSVKAIRWGHDSDIQRYRCKDCGKTFNSLTGSPLLLLRHHEKWFDYQRCMQEGLTLRESAKCTGIDLTTAFRWRHRFLEPITDSDSILCTDGAGWYRTFANAHALSNYRLIKLDNQRVIDNIFHIQHVNGYISGLKGWMKRFYGVGTAYLVNYLAWRRLFETTIVDVKIWLQIALRPHQRSLQT